jgi:hypothetical protein
LEASLELSVLEWCVGWSATVPEFQGHAGNNILHSCIFSLENKKKSQGASQIRQALKMGNHNHVFD